MMLCTVPSAPTGQRSTSYRPYNPATCKRGLHSLAETGYRLHVVADGTQALAFLRREDGHDSAPRPGAILLDLNLPGLDGREVLARVETDDALRAIQVVVLTSSHTDRDVTDSYEAHANAYIAKPIDAVDFAQVIHQIAAFFTTVVKLSEASRSSLGWSSRQGDPPGPFDARQAGCGQS